MPARTAFAVRAIRLCTYISQGREIISLRFCSIKTAYKKLCLRSSWFVENLIPDRLACIHINDVPNSITSHNRARMTNDTYVRTIQTIFRLIAHRLFKSDSFLTDVKLTDET